MFDKEAKSSMNTPINQVMIQNKPELAIIVISPTIVNNNDFVYVIDELYRSKFAICAMKKRAFTKEDIQFHFEGLIPRVHNIEHLEMEFKRGDAVIFVVEKANCIKQAQMVIGPCSIKTGTDFTKHKKTGNKGF